MADLRTGALVDLDQMQKVLEDFTEATGFATVAVDTRGLPVTKPCGFTDFCKKVREDPQLNKLCHGCDAHGGLQSLINGEPHVYRCHAGLVDFSIPVTAGDTYVGAILCGQVRVPNTEQPDYLTPDSSWPNVPELISLHEQVPLVSRRRVRAAAETLLGLHSEVDGMTSRSLLPSAPSGQNLDVPNPGGRPLLPVISVVPSPESPTSPADLPGEREKTPPFGTSAAALPPMFVRISDDHRQSISPLAEALTEEDLTGAVDEATRLLNEAYEAGSDRRALIVRLEDVLIQIAADCAPRASAQASQIVQRQRGRRTAYDSRYQSQLHIERLLIVIVDELERSRPQRRREIGDLLNSISRTPQEPLSLSAAARLMHMSPGHLSKLFKSVTGCTFVSYVTARRISRARLMLASTQMSVKKIATELGFNQVNYFSRVFRAYTGASPSDYRRQCSSRDGRPAGAHLSTHNQPLLRA